MNNCFEREITMCASNKIIVPKEYVAAVSPKAFDISDADMCAIVAGIGNLSLKDKRVRIEESEFNDKPRINIVLTVTSYTDFSAIAHAVGVIREGASNFYYAAVRKLCGEIPKGTGVWVGMERDENKRTIYSKDGISVKELIKLAKEVAKGSKAKSKEKAPVEVEEEEPAVAGNEAPPSSTF
jgi:hypothetical protein